jgi:hypothetical protein
VRVNLGIVVPLIVLPIALVGVFFWYRRSIADMRADQAKPVSGLRLTAEALHRAPSPPWRVVYEIGGALGDVDHVLVGPPGVTAITTMVGDRPRADPSPDARSDARLISDAAIARGPLDELLRPVGSSCDRSARVYWGTPDPKRSAADKVVHGSLLIEGQRLGEWMTQATEHAAEPLDQDRIDMVWRTISVGIGRPDPLR